MSGKFALIIGNHAYRNPGLAPLTAPGKIAAALARFLESKHLSIVLDRKAQDSARPAT